MSSTKSVLAAFAMLLAGAAVAAAQTDAPARIAGAAAEAQPAFEALEEGAAVALDLDFALAPGETGWLEAFDLSEGECPFGPLESASAFQPPIGDNHFLLEVRMGSPEAHAANLASCEYSTLGGAPEAFFRLRGCFRALWLSIPTARMLVLNPMPPAACEPGR